MLSWTSVYDLVLISGDFNVNLLENSRRSCNFVNMFSALSLDILPLSATYQHSLLHNLTWLDLIITNNKSKILSFLPLGKFLTTDFQSIT
jgi:hypothetical protein